MEVNAAAETWLDRQPSDFFFFSGLQKFEQRAKKCIELRGEYVEQIPSLVAVACFLPCRARDLSARPRIPTGVVAYLAHWPLTSFKQFQIQPFPA